MSTATDHPRPYDLIVFDLDDTLLDTSGGLIPKASRESCEAMIAAGLQTSVEACLLERETYMRSNPRRSVYEHLANHFASSDKFAVLQAGYQAFYSREVEENLHLVPGALELLQSLKGRYRLNLLTAGTLTTQTKKVSLLKIADFFDEIFYVDPAKGESKESVFAQITRGHQPQRLLSVGNRVDTDLAPAKKLRWKTCWVRYGEYRHMTPISRDETADFEITSLEELASQCRL